MLAISIKTKNANLVAKRLERLRKKTPDIATRRLYDVAVAIRNDMRKAGQKPTYPIQWDSEKQRRAYFATDAFTLKGKRPKGYKNKHIPYHRSRNGYEKAWDIMPAPKTKSGAPSGYIVYNPRDYGFHISGDARGRNQSRIHKGRWPVFRERVRYHTKRLPRSIVDHVKAAALSEGFKVS